jgi:hypothetical protein
MSQRCQQRKCGSVNSDTLDTEAFCEDCLSSPEVEIGRSEVVEALVIANVVILREGIDLPFEIRQSTLISVSFGEFRGSRYEIGDRSPLRK